VGPRVGLDRCAKSRPPPGFDPRTVQPVARRYTGCATRPTGQVTDVNIIRGMRVACWITKATNTNSE